MSDWVESVWRYMPADFIKPANVSTDGKGGVTVSTFTEFKELTFERVNNRLLEAGIPPISFSTPQDLSNTLESVIAQVIAAYILRKFKNYQELYRDYFANAYASLDEFIKTSLMEMGIAKGSPEFVDDSPVTDVDYGFPTHY